MNKTPTDSDAIFLANVRWPAYGDRLMRQREVSFRTGFARSTIYKKMSVGKFPQAIRDGARFTAWREADIQAWIEEKCRGESDDR